MQVLVHVGAGAGAVLVLRNASLTGCKSGYEYLRGKSRSTNEMTDVCDRSNSLCGTLYLKIVQTSNNTVKAQGIKCRGREKKMARDRQE